MPDFNFLMYHGADGDVAVNALIKDETIWLTQTAVAKLFGVGKPAINKHLKNIYAKGVIGMADLLIRHNKVRNGKSVEALLQGKGVFYIITRQPKGDIYGNRISPR